MLQDRSLISTVITSSRNSNNKFCRLAAHFVNAYFSCYFFVVDSTIAAQGNSIKIIDIDGLLSGIATAQYSMGVHGVMNFNGVLYNVSTGVSSPTLTVCLAHKYQAEFSQLHLVTLAQTNRCSRMIPILISLEDSSRPICNLPCPRLRLFSATLLFCNKV